MKVKAFLDNLVDPVLALMASHPDIAIPVSDRARVEVTTIAGQESRWKDRRQIGIGQYYPQTVGARGYWQFESTWGGPVALNQVMQSTPRQLKAVCDALEIPVNELALYEAIAWNDTLACACARLLLWQDPMPLPQVGDKIGAWNYYVRNWSPGSPHPETWNGLYDEVLEAMKPPA